MTRDTLLEVETTLRELHDDMIDDRGKDVDERHLLAYASRVRDAATALRRILRNATP